MESMLNALEEKGILFFLKYEGTNDLGTYWEIKSMLENKEFMIERLTAIRLDGIATLNDYLDYLCLQKLARFKEMIPNIIDDGDKKTICSIAEIASGKCEKIEKSCFIQFVNEKYQEVFEKKYHKYSLPAITLERMIPLQDGISQAVFEHLAKNYNYLLLRQYHNLQKKFEKTPQLFKLLFRHKNLEEIRELQFDHVFTVFVKIWNGNNKQLKEIVEPIIETVIADMERLVLGVDLQNIQIVAPQFDKIYKFLKQIGHPKANRFYEYSINIKHQLMSSIIEYGTKVSYQISIEDVMKKLKCLSDWKSQLLLITHKQIVENGSTKCISRLDCKSKGKQGLCDISISNIDSDEYFTHSHQVWLNMNVAVGATLIATLWDDKELFPACLQWHYSALNFIAERVRSSETLAGDFEMLNVMLHSVILSADGDSVALSPLCYGAGVFICALMEKVLRIVYSYLLKDKQYVLPSSLTLGNLLSQKSEEMAKIFGIDHLKNLSFLLCTVGEKKIGENLRNNLVHWVEMKNENINRMLVAKIFFLYTDVLNTVFWHFYSLNDDDSTGKI